MDLRADFWRQQEHGFFIDTAADDELEVIVTATLPDSFTAKGKAGVFGALIDADGPSTFSGTYESIWWTRGRRDWRP